jgi:hypothetical protein
MKKGPASEELTTMAGRRLPASGSLWIGDAAAVALLAGLSVLLFRDSLFNGLYIGNPDRLNSNLKILKYYVDGLAQGHLDAWSPFEMLGYDTFALPYTFPSLFMLIAYLAGASRLDIVAGYEVIALLALAGAAAYAFLRVEIRMVFPALIGAVLYEFSALTILKVSQNDLSFAVFILIPVIMLAVRRISPANLVGSFVGISTLIVLLLHFTFLQKASYALILAGCYAVYRSASKRDWNIVVVFGAGCVVGLIGAFPRLYGIAVAIAEYSRSVAGRDFSRFDEVYKFQAVFPSQMLRWFDAGIFGLFPSDAALNLGNFLNLTEGFLLYTSSLVPFLIIFGLFRYGRRPFELLYGRRNDAAFFFWFMCFTFSVIALPWMLELVWLLYLRMDFTHARILIVGLLPLSLIVGLLLADMLPRDRVGGRQNVVHWLVAILLATALVGAIEAIAGAATGSIFAPYFYSGLHLPNAALVRIGLSALSVALVLLAISERSSRRLFGATLVAFFVRPGVRRILCLTIGLAIGLHTFVGADFQVNGPQTRASPPFLSGDMHYSTKNDFRPPGPEAVAALNRRLDNDNYRSALLCDPNIAGGFCAGHIPEFWRLRVVDGYYGLGVPMRLASLPWKTGLSLRTISFSSPSELDWPILSLLNVKYVAQVSADLYRNNSAENGAFWRPADPNEVKILPNPLPVTPRYFFARHVVPVTGVSEAATMLFPKDGLPGDVTETSFVEGGLGKADYADGLVIAFTGTGDRTRISVSPSESERFLVANELAFPGWSAAVDGKSTPVYATNAVMRGVVVPAGTTTIEFFYTPVVRREVSLAFYGTALFLLVAGSLLFGRRTPVARR